MCFTAERNLTEPVESHFRPLPEAICRACLDKVAGSLTFSQAKQLQRLLKWLGERTLAPSMTAPSEREIAAEVLARKDFDSKPIRWFEKR